MTYPIIMTANSNSGELTSIAYIPAEYGLNLVEIGVASRVDSSDGSFYVLVNKGSETQIHQTLTGLLMTAKAQKLADKFYWGGFEFFGENTSDMELMRRKEQEEARQDPELVKLANELLPNAIRAMSEFIEANKV